MLYSTVVGAIVMLVLYVGLGIPTLGWAIAGPRGVTRQSVALLDLDPPGEAGTATQAGQQQGDGYAQQAASGGGLDDEIPF